MLRWGSDLQSLLFGAGVRTRHISHAGGGWTEFSLHFSISVIDFSKCNQINGREAHKLKKRWIWQDRLAPLLEY
jgi:hypothetical protein